MLKSRAEGSGIKSDGKDEGEQQRRASGKFWRRVRAPAKDGATFPAFPRQSFKPRSHPGVLPSSSHCHSRFVASKYPACTMSTLLYNTVDRLDRPSAYYVGKVGIQRQQRLRP